MAAYDIDIGDLILSSHCGKCQTVNTEGRSFLMGFPLGLWYPWIRLSECWVEEKMNRGKFMTD